jgi:2-methylaconitate cis-trans-isomerase PrpF
MMSGHQQVGIPAVYMRGGTSRALMFHARDLPPAGDWAPIFAAALGSPDAYGRQLDGLGGGISSLSKVAVIAPSLRPDADVDFTFAQVAIDRVQTSLRGNCGNISSAVGPFAVDEGLVQVAADRATVRIFNTNTGKIIRAEFPLVGGRAAIEGDLPIDGVSGTGAPVRLAFLDPGGATTGRLLPTGQAIDLLTPPAQSPIRVSLVDAANPVVFLAATDLGLEGDETPGVNRAEPRSDVPARGHPRPGQCDDGRCARCRGGGPRVPQSSARRDRLKGGRRLGRCADQHDLRRTAP